MNVKDLQAFVIVVRSGTVTEAAAKLSLTQPAVSKIISNLEESLGFSLFERRKRRLALTQEGVAFLSEVESALARFDELYDTAANIRQGRFSRVRLVAMPTLAHGLLPTALLAFREKHPDALISVEVNSRSEVAKWVAGRDFDIGLVALPVANPSVSSEPFIKTKTLAALPAGHRLANKRSITLSDLAGESLVGLSSDSFMQRHINRQILQAADSAKLMIDTTSLYAVCNFVACGHGCGVVDPFTAYAARSDRIAFVPLEAEMTLEYGLVKRKGRAPTPLVEELTETIQRHAYTVVPKHLIA
ncbi:MAG: LysR family transcriptional regulator [Alphaproteobacteria bacterium]|nr:LysR family transcriptional regulator [Alphaproteobacteria bacterium]